MSVKLLLLPCEVMPLAGADVVSEAQALESQEAHSTVALPERAVAVVVAVVVDALVEEEVVAEVVLGGIAAVLVATVIALFCFDVSEEVGGEVDSVDFLGIEGKLAAIEV